jgi:response regulator RpfG family c-di-GMP phosphodiesterase
MDSQPDLKKSPSMRLPIDLKEESFPDNIVERIEEAQFYLQLENLKFFDSKGKIVYSTDEKDIGNINTNPYFSNHIAKGKNLSKIVQKDSVSAENRMLKMDVAEIYIPLMSRSKFQGALEIYYDISQRKQALDLLVSKTLMVIYSLTIVFLISVGIVLNKASIQMIHRKNSDVKLQKANQTLETRVTSQTEEIRQTQKVSVKALATLAEFYDSDTGEHLTRIQSYVEILVKWLKENSHFKNYLSEKVNYIDELKLASLLHDVGKTAIPIEILTKPGKITYEEFEIIKTHTTIAGDALTTANDDFRKSFMTDSYLALARDIALYHHEKWNGKGYPKSLSGESIPLSARIVAVADVYDALRSKRPYKKPWSHLKAVDEIVSGKGEHFDPEVIKAFISQADKFHTISKIDNDK